jgi:hypothetical protein
LALAFALGAAVRFGAALALGAPLPFGAALALGATLPFDAGLVAAFLLMAFATAAALTEGLGRFLGADLGAVFGFLVRAAMVQSLLSGLGSELRTILL